MSSHNITVLYSICLLDQDIFGCERINKNNRVKDEQEQTHMSAI